MNVYIKLLFQEVRIWLTLTPGGHKQFDLCAPRGNCKWSRWYPSHCVPGGDVPPPRTQIKTHRSADERMLGKLPDCSFYLINLFPEFHTPPPTLFFFLIKKVGLKWNVRQSSGASFSQIAGHLNEVSIRIPSLSLLIGPSGGRQHECHLFWFQYYALCHTFISLAVR